MSADEFRCRVYNDVRTVFDRADDKRSEGVVHDEEHAVLVCDLGNGIEVCHVRVGVAEGFGVNDFRVGLYGSFQPFQVVDIDDGVADALC